MPTLVENKDRYKNKKVNKNEKQNEEMRGRIKMRLRIRKSIRIENGKVRRRQLSLNREQINLCNHLLCKACIE
jgi:hypothetical protein